MNTIQKKYYDETGENWLNSQDEPDIDYVEWLEQSLVKESDSLPCVRLSFPSEKEISMMANDYSTQEGKYRVASYEAFRDGANRIAKILQSNEA